MTGRGRRAGLAALALIAMLTHAAPAGATEAESGASSWLHPVARTGLLYGTLYATAFAVSTSARLGIAAVAPAAWLGTAQTFGLPAAIVLVMSQAIPAFKLWIPEMVDRWFEQPAVNPALSSRPQTSG